MGFDEPNNDSDAKTVSQEMSCPLILATALVEELEVKWGALSIPIYPFMSPLLGGEPSSN